MTRQTATAPRVMPAPNEKAVGGWGERLLAIVSSRSRDGAQWRDDEVPRAQLVMRWASNSEWACAVRVNRGHRICVVRLRRP